MNYIIRAANINDKEGILKIWNDKDDKPNLSIPFNCEIDKCIKECRMYVVYDENYLIGFGAYQIIKKCPEIRVKHLCVDKHYRKRHIVSNIILSIILDTYNTGLPIVAICRDGADNNKFYEKYKKENYTIIPRKTLNCRRYILDKNEIIRRCNNGIQEI